MAIAATVLSIICGGGGGGGGGADHGNRMSMWAQTKGCSLLQLDERVKTRRYKHFVAKGARRTFSLKTSAPKLYWHIGSLHMHETRKPRTQEVGIRRRTSTCIITPASRNIESASLVKTRHQDICQLCAGCRACGFLTSARCWFAAARSTTTTKYYYYVPSIEDF